MQQSNLEQANVEVVSEISDLIAAQRAYEDERQSRQRRRPDAAIRSRAVPLGRLIMAVRSFLVAGALLAASVLALAGNDAAPRRVILASTIQTAAAIPIPALRGRIDVTDEVVRIGDLVDNAGDAAQIAIYRSPNPGITGSLSATQVLDVLRAHQVIGVETHGIRNVAVTRLARTLDPDDVELRIAVALEHAMGLATPRTCC